MAQGLLVEYDVQSPTPINDEGTSRQSTFTSFVAICGNQDLEPFDGLTSKSKY